MTSNNDVAKVSKILIGVDRSKYSEKAFHLACVLAAKCNASLLIVNISEVVGADRVDEIENFALSKKAAAELKEGGNLPLLEHFVSEANSAGVTDVQTLTTSGHVAEMILRIADNENPDMIVLGTRGLNAPKEFLLGSVSHHISHHAKCTVVIAK